MIMYTSGHHRSAQGRDDHPSRGRRRYRRAGPGLGVDRLDDTLVHGLPLFHVHGLVLGLLGSLRIGNRFVHTGKPTPQAYAEAGGTCTSGCRRCGHGSSRDTDAARALSSARLLVSGSAALPMPVFDGSGPADRACARSSVMAAPRSLITISTLRRRRAPPRLGGSAAGRCADPAGRRRPASRCPTTGNPLGSFRSRARRMFSGYLNRPDATAEAFDADGWYRTGDVAVIDADGMHRIVGRESVDLIKSGGYRIGAGEIETVLLGHPGVRRGRGGRGARRRPRASGSSRSWSGDAEPQAAHRLCRRTTFGAQAATGGAHGGQPCRVTRWARCSRRS